MRTLAFLLSVFCLLSPARGQMLIDPYTPFQAAGGGGFAPTDVSGLIVWLKSESLSGSDGDEVLLWADSSGNGNDAIGTTGTTAPHLTNNVAGTFEAMYVDGSADFLQWTNTTVRDALRTKTGWSVFIVARRHATGTGKALTYFSTAVGTVRLEIASGITSSGDWLLQGRNTDGVGAWTSDVGKYPGNTTVPFGPFLLSAVVDLSAQTAAGYTNGVQVINDTSIGDGNAISDTRGTVAYIARNAGQYFTGYIFEYLLYDNTVSGANVTNINNYLISKYSL